MGGIGKCENGSGCDLKRWSTVAQTSESAVSRVSKPAAATQCVGSADLEVGDTAGLETCATIDHQFESHPRQNEHWTTHNQVYIIPASGDATRRARTKRIS